jgi:hypothetical protein
MPATVSETPSSQSVQDAEHVDILIIGAGISGIGRECVPSPIAHRSRWRVSGSRTGCGQSSSTRIAGDTLADGTSRTSVKEPLGWTASSARRGRSNSAMEAMWRVAS